MLYKDALKEITKGVALIANISRTKGGSFWTVFRSLFRYTRYVTMMVSVGDSAIASSSSISVLLALSSEHWSVRLFSSSHLGGIAVNGMY
jgi:hypothetical protein